MVVLSQRAQHFEGGEHAQGAVQPAPVGYGVEMAAQDECRIRLAFQRSPGVAGGVEVMLDWQLRQLGLEPCACIEPDGGPGDSLRALLVGGELA